MRFFNYIYAMDCSCFFPSPLLLTLTSHCPLAFSAPHPLAFSMVVTCAFLLAFPAIAVAQSYSLPGADNSYSFSSQMRGGSKEIPLLSLPKSFDQKETILNRSIGGIGGSSFDTEEATPEQTLRALNKLQDEPHFVAEQSIFSVFRDQSESAEARPYLVRSFETTFSAPSFAVEEGSLHPNLNIDLNLLGGRKKRGILRGIVPTFGGKGF